jgi:hypothetical protein
MALGVEAEKNGVLSDRSFVVKLVAVEARFVAIQAQQPRLGIGTLFDDPVRIATKSGGPIERAAAKG